MATDNENYTNAIFEIAKAIRESQCIPPAGAQSPFEFHIVIHMDEETRKSIDGIELGISDISASLDYIGDAIRQKKV